ncbi:MAG: hypothetical protein APR55_06515 [Methanolinea sp. SDB]|nr:MAG: hypothetical protein APR55_06515 [Methanolinea sp. SDB]
MHPADPASPAVASRLFAATILATMAGVFLGIFFLFIDTDLAVRIAVVLLVGVVGVLSWLRHTVYYRSDQARMGWSQEHPQFQMEVGYANLAIGLVALAAAGLSWGRLAYAISFFTYGLYLCGALAIHICGYRANPSSRGKKSVLNSAFFVVVLFGFGAFALLSD